jgi:hypothetical protein
MKMIRILGFALFTIFALGAISVTSAFALTEQLLVDGTIVTTAVEALVTGELKLTDLTSLGNGTVDCSASLHGTIEPGGTDYLITSLLNLTDEAISTTPLVGLALSCEGLELCTGLAEVWPDNLPWLVGIELVGSVFNFDLVADGNGSPGYHVTCKNIIGGTTEDLCTAALSNGPLENMAAPENDILVTFGTLLGICTFTGAETGHVESIAPALFFVEGKTLAVSEA